MITDRELIISIIAGDKSAFEVLLRRYDEKVLSIAYGYVGSEEDAKDIYQEVFLKVYKNLSRFEFRSEFSTWLYRITVNTCLSYKSKNKNSHLTSLDTDNITENGNRYSLKETISSESHTDTAIMSSELKQKIREAVEKLPPKQKMIFTLRYFHEHKIKEIAEIMKCSEGTVKKLLSVAIGKMRENIKNYL
jgi:RNA polymerase sigma-70 factor, ECF subfamily